MSYTSESDVKGYLDISATDYNTIIGKLVADADVEINSALDIDGFTSSTKTELIRWEDVAICGSGYYNIYLRNFNVLTVTHLNGTAYSGTKSLTGDYYIMHERKVTIKDLYNSVYQSVDKIGAFEITYTYWYATSPTDTLPSDIKLLAKLRAAVQFREKYPSYTKASTSDSSMEGVSEYQLADERVKYNTQNSQLSAEELNVSDRAEMNRILSKYRKPHVIS